MVVVTKGRGNREVQLVAVTFLVFRNSLCVQNQLSAAFTDFSDGICLLTPDHPLFTGLFTCISHESESFSIPTLSCH